MATISRFHAVVDLGKLKFEGFIAWLMWLVVHLFYIVGFKSRITTVLHWLVSFMGRGRSQRVATQQQVYGRLALEHLGPGLRGVQDRRPEGPGRRRRGRHRARIRLSHRSGISPGRVMSPALGYRAGPEIPR